MPVDLPTHLQNLTAAGAVFEPYLRDPQGGKTLIHLDGSAPARCPRRERLRLEEYWASQPADHCAAVRTLAAQLPPMAADCRIVVLLPARFERAHLPTAIAQLAAQRGLDGRPLPKTVYEVLLLDNRFAHELPDGSSEVVAALRKDDPGALANVHYLHVTFPPSERYPLTLVRRLLADVAVCRALARGEYRTPLYFAPEDADTVWMDPCQLAIQVKTLDDAPYLDAVRGQQDRCPWIMLHNDLLVTLRRSWNFTETLFSRRSLWPDRNPSYNFTWNRIVTSGWNTAFTAEAYAMIRGYTPDRRMGEDVDTGERISCVRGRYMGERFVPQMGSTGRLPTRTEGSPRRWLLRVAEGAEPYDRRNQYENFFGPCEHRARNTPLEELVERAAHNARVGPGNLDQFEEALSKDFAVTLRVFPDAPQALAQYQRVLRYLGFGTHDVVLLPGENRVVIRSYRGLAAFLERFRCRNLRPPAAYAGDMRDAGRRVTWRVSPLRT